MKRAALLVHGFMGKSGQFAFLDGALKDAGYDVHALTLAGHGGTLDEFTRHGRADWRRSVDESLARLREEYDEIHIVGHSMGGLLAVNAAAQNPDKLERITALALPLFLKLTARGFHIRVRTLGKPREDDGDEVRAARALCGVAGITLWNAPRLLPNTFGLFAVMRRTRGALLRLTVPLTVVNSKNDELVSNRALAFVRDALPGCETVELGESSHFWYSDADRAAIRRRIYCDATV